MKILTTGIFLLGFMCGFSQAQSDSIEVRHGLGTTFRQNGKILSLQQLILVTQSDAGAYNEMRKAKKNHVIGNVFGLPGGFLVGWPMGSALAGGKPNWSLAGVGAGLIIIGIPFNAAAVKHAKKAVVIYNANLKHEIPAAPKDSTQTNNPVPLPSKTSAELASNLYFTSADSNYQNYCDRFKLALEQDSKIISFEYREYKYGNGQIKSRGFKAKHKYSFNEEYSYKIGTWEYYTKEGVQESTVNYNLKEEIVK